MSKKEKLISRLRSKPGDFTFNEAESLLVSLGFKKLNRSGSRVCFVKNGIKINVHKPHPRNILKDYQVIDIVNKLEREGLL